MSAAPGDRPATVLVVDDNMQNREVAEGHLVGAGYQVIQAEGGAEALSIMTASRPDLVLLDVLMPGMDGYETCRRIRALPEGATRRSFSSRHWAIWRRTGRPWSRAPTTS